MEQRVKQVLLDLGYDESGIHLSSGDRVCGRIVSTSFRGLDQLVRQNKLWDQLGSRMTPGQLEQVGVILTMTPEEIKE